MDPPVGYFNGVPIFVSNRAHKKYAALVNGAFVHFGDNRYEQYHDKIGYYSRLNHGDVNRRDQYYRRHGAATPLSPKYFSHAILWPLDV